MSKAFFVLCFAAAIAISACSNNGANIADVKNDSKLSSDASKNNSQNTGLILNQAIEIDGVNRTYDLFVPTNQKDSPIVMMLHGHRSNSRQMIGGDGSRAPYKLWLEVAEENNIVLAIPNGLVGSDRQTGWNDCRTDASGNPEVDDVGFLEQMIDAIADDYSINRKRIFATGTSNGGHMAIRIAQDSPELLAAIAVVAALMPVNSACNDSDTPISALFINGTEDPIAPYGGGEMKGDRGEVLSGVETGEYWIRRNELTAPPLVTSIPDVDTSDRSTAEKAHYKGGTAGTEFLQLKIVGGGHTEPSITQPYRAGFKLIVGNQNRDFEMAEEVWSFFESKTQ